MAKTSLTPEAQAKLQSSIKRQNQPTDAIPVDTVNPVEQSMSPEMQDIPDAAPVSENEQTSMQMQTEMPLPPEQSVPMETAQVSQEPRPQIQTTAVPMVDNDFLQSQTSGTIADMVANNKITTQDIQSLAQVDPLKFQEVNTLIGKKRLEGEINQERQEYKDVLTQYSNDLERVRKEGGKEAVERYKQATQKPELDAYTSEINTLTTDINDIDDKLEYMLDDFIANNPSGDPRAILGIASEARKEMIRERNTKVASLQLAQNNYNRIYNEAIKEYEIFTEAEAQARDAELTILSERFGISKEQIGVDLEVLTEQMANVDNMLSGIADTKQLQQEFEQELMMKQIDQGFEMEKMDIEFQRDMARDDVKFQRDIWQMNEKFNYDSILKSMDIESRFALAKYNTQEQLNIMQAKHALDQEIKDYAIDFQDDGSVIAVNKNDPTDYRLINKDGGKPMLDLLGENNSRGGEHDNYQGMDFKGNMNDPLPGVGGTVVNVVSGKGQSLIPSYGNYVDIKDKNGYVHRYAHLSDVKVQKGDTIADGQIVGLRGNSGYVLTQKGDQRVPPTPEEWAAGSGAHLDYSIQNPDGTWKKSREIPGYVSTLQKPAIDNDKVKLLRALQSITPDQPGFSRAIGDRVNNLNPLTGFGLFAQQGFVRRKIEGESTLGFTRGTDAGDFAIAVENVKNILTVPELQVLKGPTSDKDIDFIQTASTKLNTDLTEQEFIEIRDELENIMLREIGLSLEEVLGLEDFDSGENTQASNYLLP